MSHDVMLFTGGALFGLVNGIIFGCLIWRRRDLGTSITHEDIARIREWYLGFLARSGLSKSEQEAARNAEIHALWLKVNADHDRDVGLNVAVVGQAAK